MQQEELVTIRLYDGAVTTAPVGTIVAKVYYDGNWHYFRCFVQRDNYDRSADAERYKRELKFVGCGLPIELEYLHPSPIES